METKISDLHIRYYIPAIQELDFHLPHVRILGTNQCGEIQQKAFKGRELFQNFICCLDYAERVVSIFANKVQS